MSLIERCFIEGIAKVLTFGAKKYAARNYRNGAVVSRYLDAALRHIVAFSDGENNDQESGENHLHHAACCLMMADWMHRNKPELDDRTEISAVNQPLSPTLFASGGFVGQAPKIDVDKNWGQACQSAK